MPVLTTLVVIGLTVAPTGFYRLCAEQPVQCAASFGSMPTMVQIDAINRKINTAMRPQAEIGNADVWQVGTSSGDCEDFAMTKRAALIRAGIASAYARIAAGETDKGARHAVLVVTTSAGQFVLDNLTNQIKFVGSAGIKIDEMMSAENPRVWVKVR